MMQRYEQLKEALEREIHRHNLSGRRIDVICKALSSKEAIGTPEHDDYPIVKGREVMIEAAFNGAKGQAFSDEFAQGAYRVEDLFALELNSNKQRATFVAGLNAIFKSLNLCEKTIHCKDREPLDCAEKLLQSLPAGRKVLQIGFQPRFLDMLAAHRELRVIDLDPDNIGKTVSGIVVESPEQTDEAIRWCDLIFATGSTLVNGTMSTFLNQDKPAIFYGITGSAAAKILNLETYCHCGH